MSLGRGIAHCVTILSCSGHYHLLYSIVEVTVAHCKLQEAENHFPDKTVDDKSYVRTHYLNLCIKYFQSILVFKIIWRKFEVQYPMNVKTFSNFVELLRQLHI